MPYIKTTANVPIPPEKREAIKTKLGQLAPILGKKEQTLMVDFCENSPLYFAGTSAPAAMIAVDLRGSSGAEAYAKFTPEVAAFVGEALGISQDRIFVKYFESDHWGLFGRQL